MKQRPRIYYSETQKALMWERWRKGDTLHEIARLFNRHHPSVQRILAQTGGIARKLTIKFGRGWSEQQLRHCMRLAEIYPDEPILSAVRRELSWTQIKTLMYLDAPLKRDFYAELCRLEHWSSRQLNERIQSMLYERSALSRNPDDVIGSELSKVRASRQLSPDLVLKDPYILDFLGLSDPFRERDLEDAILREMEQFLLELGAGFTFIARQKRLQIDDDDFYLDLLFYNRKLKRLVVVELKLGAFKASSSRLIVVNETTTR